MAYDENLARRIRKLLADQVGLTEKKMFGGVSFMLRGNMARDVLNDEMVVRVDPDQHDAAITHPGVRTFDYAGRPMKGWIFVRPKACKSDEALHRWVSRGIQYALSLRAK